MNMRAIGTLVAFGGAVVSAAQAQDAGEKVFKSTCAACHTIGGGRLVGPDLQGLHERRTDAWIVGFVQHPQQVITSGDSAARRLFAEFQEFAMPDQALSADEIRQVLAYIRRTESFGTTPAAVALGEPTDEQVQLGQELFDGRTRFANAGPACHSCHEVSGVAVIGGGSLAKDLTPAFSRLTGAGVEAIIRTPPFPVMQRAYQNKPLIEEEVVALTSFLRRMGEQQALHHPPGVGPRLAAAGVTGGALLLVLYSLAWGKRSKSSVYQRIYDRQIKST
jgi:mono/diheme cytochrome c family protein